jgi:hypothetical protein
MEGVRGLAAVRGGVDQWIDDLQLLDDRTRPAVRDDQRQSILVLGTDMDEVDVQPVDLGEELRVGLQLRLGLAPVVLRRSVAGDLLRPVNACTRQHDESERRTTARSSLLAHHRQSGSDRAAPSVTNP